MVESEDVDWIQGDWNTLASLSDAKAELEVFLVGPLGGYGLVRARINVQSKTGTGDTSDTVVAHLAVLLNNNRDDAQLVLRRQLLLQVGVEQFVDLPFMWESSDVTVEASLTSKWRRVKRETHSGFRLFRSFRGYPVGPGRTSRATVFLSSNPPAELQTQLSVATPELNQPYSLPRDAALLAANMQIAWGLGPATDPELEELMIRYVKEGGALHLPHPDSGDFPAALVERLLGAPLDRATLQQANAAMWRGFICDDIKRQYRMEEYPASAPAVASNRAIAFPNAVEIADASASYAPLHVAPMLQGQMTTALEQGGMPQARDTFTILPVMQGYLIVWQGDSTELANRVADKGEKGSLDKRLIQQLSLQMPFYTSLQNQVVEATRTSWGVADVLVPPQWLVILLAFLFFVVPGVVLFGYFRKRYPAGIFLLCGGCCIAMLIGLFAVASLMRISSDSAATLDIVLLDEAGNGMNSVSALSLVHSGEDDVTLLPTGTVVGPTDEENDTLQITRDGAVTRVAHWIDKPWVSFSTRVMRELPADSFESGYRVELQEIQMDRATEEMVVRVQNTGTKRIELMLVYMYLNGRFTAIPVDDLAPGEEKLVDAESIRHRSQWTIREQYADLLPERMLPVLLNLLSYGEREMSAPSSAHKYVLPQVVIFPGEEVPQVFALDNESGDRHSLLIAPLTWSKELLQDLAQAENDMILPPPPESAKDQGSDSEER